jgi:TPR repeat protein
MYPQCFSISYSGKLCFWGGIASILIAQLGTAGCAPSPNLLPLTGNIRLYMLSASPPANASPFPQVPPFVLFSAEGEDSLAISRWLGAHRSGWSWNLDSRAVATAEFQGETYDIVLNGDTMRFSAPNRFEKNDWDEMERNLSAEDQQFWNSIVKRIESSFTTVSDYELKLAEAGSATAQYAVAHECLDGTDGCKKDITKARTWLERSAAQDDLDAVEDLANLLRDGFGGLQDDNRACALYLRAIRLGRNTARAELAWMLENGRGGPKDLDRARELYREAAEGGFAWASWALGREYRDAVGVRQDYVKAMECFQDGAKFSDTNSMNAIAWLYSEGKGVARDDAQAFDWFEKAGMLGHATSINSAGWCLLKGIGVKSDPVQAEIHFKVAAEYGAETAMHNLVDLYQAGAQGVPRDQELARYWQTMIAQSHAPVSESAHMGNKAR